MQFICQVPFGPDLFAGAGQAVAYLFMTCSGDVDQTWAPDGGENALIVLPQEDLTASLTVGDAPRLCRMVKKLWRNRLVPESCTFSAKLTMTEDPVFIPEATLSLMPEASSQGQRRLSMHATTG